MHLTSSRFLGGPERQMLGLAKSLRSPYETTFVSFSEGSLCRAFLDSAHADGFEAIELMNDTPHLLAAHRELKRELRRSHTQVLFCHGYKAGVIGLLSAKSLGLPVFAVSRGWTGESLRVQFYEAVDRLVIRAMNKIVCVSQGQALKVKKWAISPSKITVIKDSVDVTRFSQAEPEYRVKLDQMFAVPPAIIVGAAGRLSPEKGYRYLIEAAAKVRSTELDVGFVLFGAGQLHEDLRKRIDALGIADRFKLAGFTRDIDKYMHHFDIFALPSFTEGLPNVVLESFAAKVPVIATSVGGTPEVVEDGVNGFLVPAGDAQSLAKSIVSLASDKDLRHRMGERGYELVRQHFSFDDQAAEYHSLITQLVGPFAKDNVAQSVPEQI